MEGKVAAVDNAFRRKWNREEYLERARERDEDDDRHKSKSKGPPVQRKPLKHRDFEVDLTSRLGKTQVVTPVAPLSQQAGFFCSVCECVVKDSANYLDHINGKKHQRALGMSMRVERATLEQVQSRFENLKRKKNEGGFTEQDFDMKLLKQQQEEEERKRQRREKKKEKKREKASEEDVGDDVDSEMAAMMGFGGFGSSKRVLECHLTILIVLYHITAIMAVAPQTVAWMQYVKEICNRIIIQCISFMTFPLDCD